MITATRSVLRAPACIAAAGILLATLAACSDTRAATGPAAAGMSGVGDGSGAARSATPLPDASRQLLELAIGAASAIPVEPHVKDRSRAQEAVVAACLELDQPQLANSFIESIDNWRRGCCWADLARHLAERGETEAAGKALGLAREVAESAELASTERGEEQAWRRDRIRAGIARACLALGQVEEAESFAADIAASESSEFQASQALLADSSRFDEQLAALDEALAAGSFDDVRNALVTCARLFDRDFADEGRRARLEQRITGSLKKLPVALSLQLLLDLTDAALDHGDGPAAIALLDVVQQTVDGQGWLPEDHVRLTAQLAGLRGRTGDVETARAQLAAALDLFDAARARIPDIDRAEALRAVAEGYQSLGDTPAALAVYARAVEAGAENPNARPRAEDLSATCCSMATSGALPGPELLARLRQLRDGLIAPW